MTITVLDSVRPMDQPPRPSPLWTTQSAIDGPSRHSETSCA